MAERELVEYIRQLAAGERPPWLDVGIGDDAAVLRAPDDGRVVVTTDSVIEGVHFKAGTEPELVGRKAVARCLSDIAAMAARPLCTVAAVGFGRSYDDDACRRLCKALFEAARELSAPLVGGDVASGPGPTTVTVTALGTAGPAGVVTRSGARPGDAICVTGRLGGSIRGRHLTFRPRIPEALALAGRCRLHAMIDISDGLSTDALHIAQASGRGITLKAEAIPVSEDALALSREGEGHEDPLRHALNDGEDYELVFCLPQRDAKAAAASGVLGTLVSIIGAVTSEKDSFIVRPGGAREPLRGGGWEHLTG
jgi:thiamine-monophosphate kinase